MSHETPLDDVGRLSQLMLNSIGQAVIATDMAHRVTFWNAAAEALYGWTAQDAVGRPVGELIVPESGQQDAAVVMAVLRAGGSWSGEFTVRRRNGSTFPAMVVDSGIYSESGELVGMIGVSTDLTELKQAEQARQASERLLRTVVENTPVVLVAFDTDGMVTLAEGQDPELSGLDSPALGAKALSALLASTSEVADAVTRCLAGESVDVTWQLGGRSFDFRCRPNRDSTGRVIGAVGIGTDITSRVEAAEQAATREARWRSLVLRSADAALLADATTTEITYVSPAMTRLFGWEPEDLMGRVGLSLVHPDDRDRIADVLQVLGEDPTSHPTVEFRLECADGSYRWIEQTISNLSDVPGVEGLVGNIRDITARRAAEEALRSRERLTRALAANSTDIAMVTTIEGRILYLSPSAAVSAAIVEGESLDFENLPWVHPDDRASVHAAISDISEPGASVCGRYRRLGPDGNWRRVETTLTNCTDDPDVGGIILNTRDVTERVVAEEGLRASETRYRLIAETAQEGIWATDIDGRTLYANQKMAELMGRPLTDLYAQQSFEFALDPQTRAGMADRTKQRPTTGFEQYEVQFTRPDGSVRVVRISASPLVDDGVHLGSLGMVADITDARAAEEELRYRALHDPLTGLPNRTLLLERLQESLDRTRAAASGSVGVLVADVDQFKLVNDSFGHAAGDDLLIEVARRWQGVLRSQDTVARLGGDEFVILSEVAGESDGRQVADRLLNALVEPIELAGRAVAVSASIGIVVAGADAAGRSVSGAEDAGTLLRYADAAMYEAKAQGRSRAAVFNAGLIEQARNRLDLCNDLKAAIEGDELRLAYQPVIDLATGVLIGVEALCRWSHPVRGNVPPDQFIAAAEQTGLIETLDRWVLRRACRDGADMRATGALPLDAQIAVNVSAGHLAQAGFEMAVRVALTEAGLPARALILEVTESAVMTDPDAAQKVLESLQSLGVDVAIDDFGTGYSSLAYLRRFPVATLKIDRSFVEHSTYRADDRAIVTAVIDLARALNVSTTAEGIETFADLALLQKLGCHSGQGFLWSPALPPRALAALLGNLPHGRFPIHPTDLVPPTATPAPRKAPRELSARSSGHRPATRDGTTGVPPGRLDSGSPTPAGRVSSAVAAPAPSGVVAEDEVAQAAVHRATREALRAASPLELSAIVLRLVDELGGRAVPGHTEDEGALPVDLSFGVGPPVLAAADPASVPWLHLTRLLPDLVEDCRLLATALRTGLVAIESPAAEARPAADRPVDPPEAPAAVLDQFLRRLSWVHLDWAVARVAGLRAAGFPVSQIVDDLLAPALVEFGRRWHHAGATVADEHAATAVVEAALAVAVSSSSGPSTPGSGTNVVMICPEGEWHSLPARMASEVMRAAGIDVIFLGASLPAAALSHFLTEHRPTALAVSCTLPANLLGAARCVVAGHDAGVPVLVGGAAFGPDSRRALAIGADAHFVRVLDALPLLVSWTRQKPLLRTTPSWDEESLTAERRLPELAAQAQDGLVQRSPEGPLPRTQDNLKHVLGFAAASHLVDDPTVLSDFTAWLVDLVTCLGADPEIVSEYYALLAEIVEGELPGIGSLLRGTLIAAN
jgi:diguanylate cyclase (GGDEF)-like protein/PAS domain S-box-containing protein